MRLNQQIKKFVGVLNKAPDNQIPEAYVRYATVVGATGTAYLIQFAGSTQQIRARHISGLSASNGDTVFVIQYSTGQGSEFVVIGKLA